MGISSHQQIVWIPGEDVNECGQAFLDQDGSDRSASLNKHLSIQTFTVTTHPSN